MARCATATSCLSTPCLLCPDAKFVMVKGWDVVNVCAWPDIRLLCQLPLLAYNLDPNQPTESIGNVEKARAADGTAVWLLSAGGWPRTGWQKYWQKYFWQKFAKIALQTGKKRAKIVRKYGGKISETQHIVSVVSFGCCLPPVLCWQCPDSKSSKISRYEISNNQI